MLVSILENSSSDLGHNITGSLKSNATIQIALVYSTRSNVCTRFLNLTFVKHSLFTIFNIPIYFLG